MSQSVVWPPIGGTSYSVPEASEEDWATLTNYLVALSGAQGTTAQKWAARTAITTPVTVSSPSDCLVGVNLTTPATSVVNLPVGVVGQVFVIADMKGDAATNLITVTPSLGQTIAAAPTYTININKGAVGLVFTGAGNWSVIFQSTTGAGGAVSRTLITAGTPGYNVFNDPTTGLLSEEQFVNAVRGGLGVNASAFTGYLKATAGVFSASAIAAADLPTGIDAAKIGAGAVSNTEYGYLDGVSSPLQAQITAKLTPNAPITPATFPKITYDANGLVTSGSALAAADMPTGIDAIKIGAGLVDNTEFSRLDGVTSSIQAQLDARVTGQASSVDNEVALFSGTTGKLIKRASGTGIAVLTSGVLATATFDNITPSQASNAGKYLMTNGTTSSWQTAVGGYTVSEITANPSPAVDNTQYAANTTSAAFTITLPALVVGRKIKIQDARGTWDTNNLTIQPASGDRIYPLATNAALVCNVVRGWVELIGVTGGWSPNSLASTSLGSGGGLIGAPTSVAVNPAVNGVMYQCDTTSGSFTITLPGGTSAAVVGILDAGPFFTTNNLIVAPATGQSIDIGAVNDTITFDQNRQSCVFYRANGSSVWEIQTASNISIPEAALGVAGYVSTTTQSFSGNKTFLGSFTVSGGATFNSGFTVNSSTPAGGVINIAGVGGAGGVSSLILRNTNATNGNASSFQFNNASNIVNGFISVLNTNHLGSGSQTSSYQVDLYNAGTASTVHSISCLGTHVIGTVNTTSQHVIRGAGSTDNILRAEGGISSFRSLVCSKASNDSTVAQKFILFQINNGGANNGGITAAGANTANFEIISDARLKENVVGLPSQLSNILRLRPVEFDYKDIEGVCSPGHETGFIAQEMEVIYPESVATSPDTGYKSIVGWSKTEARLVKAIQEQQALIETLTKRLNALEAK